MRNHLRNGGFVPPVMVVQADERPGRFYLVDGYHRFWAHQALGRVTIDAIVLEGQGFTDALIAASSANLNHGLRLTKDQRVENAWRSLNLPETDYFRRMNKTQAEAALGIDRETIKKMRQKVKSWGIRAGQLDPELRGNAAEVALLSYWNEHLSPDTWRNARRDGTSERKNPHWKEKHAARALAQFFANLSREYGPDMVKKAFSTVGYHVQGKAPEDALASVCRAFSVKPEAIEPELEDTVDLAAYLEYQKQQAFDQEPTSLFNDTEHQLAADF